MFSTFVRIPDYQGAQGISVAWLISTAYSRNNQSAIRCALNKQEGRAMSTHHSEIYYLMSTAHCDNK
jgi:hypothetical protein